MVEGLDFFCPGYEGSKEEGLRFIVNKQLSPSVLARSAFCEEKLKEENVNECKQYIVFAAGYDTFSLRNQDRLLRVFELDQPHLLEDKKEHIRQAKLRQMATNIPCDLAGTLWKDQLFNVGYSKSQKAFGSLLGISYYLKKEDFEQLILNISDIMEEGSAICFDYPSTNESLETRKTKMLAAGAGEAMKASYTYEEMKELLLKCGFDIKEHLDFEKMTDRYFKDYNQANPSNLMYAPVGVEYVYAVRKLHISPLSLKRQANDGIFELIWPEQISFEIDERETLNFRDGDKLYFNLWYEDPDYREETLIRLLPEGKMIDRLSGDVFIMPNGERWLVK